MKTTATLLSALLLAACNVYLPDTATGGAPLVVLPDAAPARGLIRTGGGECLDVHGGDGKTLIRHACHGRANQQFRFDAAKRHHPPKRRLPRCGGRGAARGHARYPLPLPRRLQPAVV